MKRLLSSLLSPLGKSRKIKGVTPRARQARLELEPLETRNLMSATVSAAMGLANATVAAVQTTSSVSTVVYHVAAPSAPVFAVSSDEPTEIDFSWQPASGASGYEIEVINWLERGRTCHADCRFSPGFIWFREKGVPKICQNLPHSHSRSPVARAYVWVMGARLRPCCSFIT
jgi:hypothetical protein